MKKTFPVNINGSVFYIDEDAYQLLNTYLEQLRKAFPGKEGKEIIADIEGRIAELFNEIIAKGSRVINIEDTNRVIEQLGRPDALAEEPETGGADDKPGSNASADDQGATPPPFGGAAQSGPVRK
ncbi:MAG: PspC family transcriptional regulator, partial [Muribaculaceae bacterium]|nr:PspC family transcriptional regulator [Muribaculaceae bacterium]